MARSNASDKSTKKAAGKRSGKASPKPAAADTKLRKTLVGTGSEKARRSEDRKTARKVTTAPAAGRTVVVEVAAVHDLPDPSVDVPAAVDRSRIVAVGNGVADAPPYRSRTAEEMAVTAAGARPVPALVPVPVRRQPALREERLENGLTVVAVRKPGAPLIEVRLRIPFGARNPVQAARAELLAATLLLGTGTRTRSQVDGELALVGGHLTASVDPQRLSVSGSVLSPGLETLLAVLADTLTDPAFRRRDVLGERDRLVENLTVSASQPSVIARMHLQERRFGSHPAAWEMPDPDLVAAIGPAALRPLHSRSVVPDGSILVLVGDLRPAAAISAVGKALSSWSSPTGAIPLSPPPAVVGGPIRGFHRAGAVQSQVRLSAAGLERTDPDYPAAQLANLIYGGYFSSRLVENIREDKGYTYSAHSSLEFWPGRSAVTVSFDTTTPSTAAALLEARYELGRMALVAPKDAEVEAARNYALGTLATSLSTQAGYASTLSSLAGLGLGVDWVRAHPARLTAVTPEDVARVGATMLAPSAFTGVVLGDLDTIGAGLRAVGEFEPA